VLITSLGKNQYSQPTGESVYLVGQLRSATFISGNLVEIVSYRWAYIRMLGLDD